jgi:hypothetical protein
MPEPKEAVDVLPMRIFDPIPVPGSEPEASNETIIQTDQQREPELGLVPVMIRDTIVAELPANAKWTRLVANDKQALRFELEASIKEGQDEFCIRALNVPNMEVTSTDLQRGFAAFISMVEDLALIDPDVPQISPSMDAFDSFGITLSPTVSLEKDGFMLD